MKGVRVTPGCSNRFCWSDRHSEPCPLPCQACQVDCARVDWEDNPVNRQRTLEWLARHQPKKAR